MTRFILFELFVTNVLLFAPTKNCSLADKFSGPCGVTKYGSG